MLAPSKPQAPKVVEVAKKKPEVLRVVKVRSDPKKESPLWTPSRKSEALLFLEEELKKHNENDERKSRTCQMHQTLIRASIIQFDRLHKTLEKTEREHSEFRSATEKTMDKLIFPTDTMIDDLEKSLGESRFSYLPAPPTEERKYGTVGELEASVSATLNHLKHELVPMLKNT